MTIQYEHKGIIYHEPLPRVLLINLPQALKVLKARGDNAKFCAFSFDGYNRRFDMYAPSPPHEVDILLVRDSPVEWLEKDSSGKPSPASSYASGKIFWPNRYADAFPSFCWKILEHGGICVFFINQDHGHLLKQANLGISAAGNSTLWPKRTAHAFPEKPESASLTKFASAFFDMPSACTGFSVGPEILPFTTPLIVDAADIPYAIFVNLPVVKLPFGGTIICLPDYGDNPEVLTVFLSQTLPELKSHLFPFRHDLSWLDEPEFAHPDVLSLRSQQQMLREEAARGLDALEAKIRAIKDEEQFLRDLIVSAGDLLKIAVQAALQRLFSAAGTVDVIILDVDSDPALRNGLSEKREDLRIEWNGEAFLLNVAGREQYFRQDSINQLDRHRRLFLQANPQAQPDKVHSLLVANFNYSNGMDPRKREQMFGTGTAQAKQRLLDADHGAIATYDLYRLVRMIQSNQATVSAADLRKLLHAQGLLDFESFSSGIGPSPAAFSLNQ